MKTTIFDLLDKCEQLFEVKEISHSKEGTTYINEEDFFRNSSVDYFRMSSFSGVRLSDLNSEINDANTNNNTVQKMTSKNKYCQKDFEIISSLGNGAYGDVYKAKHKKTGEIFSIKVIDKKMIEKENKGYQIFVENEMLNYCNHPNIVGIYGYFEDKDTFSLVEEYCQKGDLAEFLNQNKDLTIEEIQFIIAQIVLCLEYLSSLKIIHRDIKPENFMINKNFKLKLIDFGTATFKGKVLDEETYRFLEEDTFLNTFPNAESFSGTTNTKYPSCNNVITHRNSNNYNNFSNNDNDSVIGLNDVNRMNTSMRNCMLPMLKDMQSPFTKSGNFRHFEIVKKQKFVGTAEYMPPEIINNQQIGEYTDIWSLMCIIFLIFTGQTPFRDKTEYLIFQNILQYKINKDNLSKIPKEASDLIFSVLKLNPTQRFGYDKVKGYDFALLKQHSFFNVKPTTNIEEITKSLIIKSNFAISMKNKNANIPQCIFEQDRKSSEISSQPSLLSDSSNNSESISKSMMSSMYQDPNGDKVIKAGKLKKRSPYFYYDLRKVILFDTPRLDYFEPETKMRKGSIPLNKECKAELVKNNQFLLKTPSRTYSFMCKEKYDITPWVVAINKAIEDCLLKESNGESRINM